MEIKTTKTVEAVFNLDDLKEILAEKLEKPKFNYMKLIYDKI